MIGTVKSAKDFGDTARYLVYGQGPTRVKDPRERVCFAATRNLFETRRLDLVQEMRDTALLSVRVKSPVAHFVISWKRETDDSPGADNPTKQQMFCTAVEVLSRLGLGEYQAWIVGHKNTEAPHVHIMINRIHPEYNSFHKRKNTAWDMWKSATRLAGILKDIAEENGWAVPAHQQTLAEHGYVKKGT